jgi:hypothetical protein
MRAPAPPLRLVAAALLSLAWSCESSQTALVLEALSELPADALDEVVFRVSGPGIDGGTREAVAPLVGPDARSFPLTLVLLGSGAATGPFAVAIEGRKEGAVRAQGAAADPAPITFVPGKVSRRQFVLRGLAGPSAMPPPPSPPPDAGAQPMSMPPPDMPPGCGAGCVCAETCAGGRRCGCSMGCDCQFTCEGGAKCELECTGAGTTCRANLGGAKGADVKCSGGALCVVDGAQVREEARLECKSADCELACGVEAAGCKLECKDGARCLLRCAGGDCKLGCDGMTRECGENVRACNRDCP